MSAGKRMDMRIAKHIGILALGLSSLFIFTGCMAKVFVDPSIGSEKSVRGDVAGKMIYVVRRSTNLVIENSFNA